MPFVHNLLVIIVCVSIVMCRSCHRSYYHNAILHSSPNQLSTTIVIYAPSSSLFAWSSLLLSSLVQLRSPINHNMHGFLVIDASRNRNPSLFSVIPLSYRCIPIPFVIPDTAGITSKCSISIHFRSPSDSYVCNSPIPWVIHAPFSASFDRAVTDRHIVLARILWGNVLPALASTQQPHILIDIHYFTCSGTNYCCIA